MKEKKRWIVFATCILWWGCGGTSNDAPSIIPTALPPTAIQEAPDPPEMGGDTAAEQLGRETSLGQGDSSGGVSLKVGSNEFGDTCSGETQGCNGGDNNREGKTREGSECVGGWTPITQMPGHGRTQTFTVTKDGSVVSMDFDGHVLSLKKNANGVTYTDMGFIPGAELFGIWGNPSSDLFAVGLFGDIFNYKGHNWKQLVGEINKTSSIKNESGEIFGGSATDLYALGYSTLYHFNGKQWRVPKIPGSEPEGLITAAAGSLSDTFMIEFADREDNTTEVYLFEEKKWRVISSPRDGRWIADIWVVSDSLTYAISDDSLFRWNGKYWRKVDVGIKAKLFDVWGRGKQDVFVGAAGGRVLHYDGYTWKQERVVAGNEKVGSIGTVLGDADWTYALGSNGYIYQRGPDGQWTLFLKTPETYLDVWGRSDNDVYIVGAEGVLLHFDGRGLQPIATGTTSTLWDIWGTRTKLYVSGDNGTVFVYNGHRVSSIKTPVDVTLEGIFALADDDVYAVGKGATIVHFDGREWKEMPCPGKVDFHGVWGTSPTNIYAVGGEVVSQDYENGDWKPDRAVVYRYDGKKWRRHASPGNGPLYGIHGSKASNIYGAGGVSEGWDNDGISKMIHFNGRKWRTNPMPGNDLILDIHVCDNQLFAVGGTFESAEGGEVWVDQSSVLMEAGADQKWKYPKPNGSDGKFFFMMYGVWCSSPNSAFAVGEGGTIYQKCGEDQPKTEPEKADDEYFWK